MTPARTHDCGQLRYSVAVLGCKVNQYEAEQIKTLLRQSGLTETEDLATSDVVIIHSCAVTAESIRKLRQSIRKSARAAPQAEIFVTGCAAKEGLVESGLPDHTCVEPGRGWLRRLSDALPLHPLLGACDELSADDILRISEFSGHHRAFLKIQDGCDNSCSYCIVPTLRGASRDKPLDEIIREAAALVRAGHREIIVSGVSIGLYGRRSGVKLSAVLDRLADIEGLERLRVSSLHPADLDHDLLSVMTAHENIMPHIHLPLQSGSDAVLSRMRRGYTGSDFLEAVERANSLLDTPAFNTDVIVGFPGETDSDFEDTLELCRQVGFSRMHIFQYSPRPGTAASGMRDEISRADLKSRFNAARALAAELAHSFRRTRVASSANVLVETYNSQSHLGQGYTERYIPASLPATPEDVGQIRTVRLTGISADGMTAEALA